MLIEIALKLIAPVILGFFIGLYLDIKFSTTPLIAVIMSVIGIFAGIYTVYVSSKR